MKSDEHPTQWLAVAIADTIDIVESLTLYDRNHVTDLPKASYPGAAVGLKSIANHATPQIPESGTIYAITA